VAQDSTGASMTGKTGDAMSYREFCEAMTSDANRAWFLTLTDAYFKLYRMNRESVEKVLESLRGLVGLLREMLKINPKEIPE
jgi:hypothetical protein